MNVATAPNIFELKSVKSRKAKPRQSSADLHTIHILDAPPQLAISGEEAQMFDIARTLRLPITFSDPSLPDCPIVFANRAFENLTGYRASVLVGNNCRFLQGSATDRDEVAKIRKAVETRSPCDAVLMNYRATGEAFHNLLVIRPIWLSEDRCLLMGSQYEFNFGARRQEIERNCYSRFEAAEEMSLKLRNLERTSRESLLVRSEAAAVKIENDIMRKRAGL